MNLTVVHASCSCEQGIQGEAMGMLGKAWSTGALMMVQVADTLPKAFHPRAKLEGARSNLHSRSETLQGRLAIAMQLKAVPRPYMRTAHYLMRFDT